MKVCAIVSFRLGLSDGVSVVASAWETALRDLGWSTLTVAGEGPVDHRIPGLALESASTSATQPTDSAELAGQVEAALGSADLVLVENLLSIPMNLPASRAVAQVLAGRPAILHHHDPPWQRERFAHITELPPDDPAWRHVTINRLTEKEFADRGLRSTTIYNGFHPDPPPGDRDRTRAALGLDPSRILVAHPVRAIARKNVPAAVGVAELLGGSYWLPGPAEEGYGAELESILGRARCPVIREPAPTIPDLYAAADVVAFPSIWEGFGNPPIEAALHRRPVAIARYPVAVELGQLGFEWYDVDDPDDLARLGRALSGPDRPGSGPGGRTSLNEALETNRSLARQHLSTVRMRLEIADLLEELLP